MYVRFLVLVVFALGLMGIAQNGATLYQQYCTACHLPTAKGTPEVIPPLADHMGFFVKSPEGRAYLVGVIASGLRGAITAGGLKYNDIMPSFNFLTDAEVAALLNHILTEFNKSILPQDFKPYTADEVKQMRVTRLSVAELLRRREAVVKQLDIK